MEKAGAREFIALVAVVVLLMFGHAELAAAAGMGPGNNCSRMCGNISIPYPFGLEPGCYHADWFNLTCNHSYRPPRLFLGDGTVQVLEISVSDSTVRINSSRLLYKADEQTDITVNGTWGRGLPKGGPYFLSEYRSSVVLVGCGTQVLVRGGFQNRRVVAFCMATCPPDSRKRTVFEAASACTGVGCCKANIDLGYDSYNIQINKASDYFVTTSSVYLADRGFKLTNNMISIYGYPDEALPATLQWKINHGSCPNSNESALECLSSFSHCQEYVPNTVVDDHGYRCSCLDGYPGNPYIPNGCSKDINECDNMEAYSCYGTCRNFPGTFECQCPSGTNGNPFVKGGCIAIKKSYTDLSIGLGVSGGIIILLLLALFGRVIMHKFKQRNVKKMKEKYFNQNHGLLLQQLISHKADIGQRMIINLRELCKATNGFDRARIIGGGGHGDVFKGILDLHVVAIKKSKIIVQREIEEFINEVAILSQVNHRNVVKLLGCCLETEVPLLVYEFISNGTLYHHLHVEGPVSLKWGDRIRIAMEVARALSYLHSAAAMPIFHRDIKSSNILLDDNLTAKVSDFGASRYIPIDRTGVTTAIQGTIGYLDPMYYYTGRLTDKSDVFSFGVLLLELITRKKPSIYRSDGGDGLVSHFISLFTKDKLVDIIDPQVMEEEDGEVQEIAILASMCTKLKGEDRPTMRDVEMTLENVLVKKKLQVPCDTAARGFDKDEIRYMEVESVISESDIHYTTEEEILLSTRHPR